MDGVLRRGAKLLHAFAAAVVPRVTLILRKSYGGAYIAMNSQSSVADAVFAWPGAEVAVLGAAAALEVIRSRELAAVGPLRLARPARPAGRRPRTAAGRLGSDGRGRFVDEVIEPVDSRNRLTAALAATPVASSTPPQHAALSPRAPARDSPSAANASTYGLGQVRRPGRAAAAVDQVIGDIPEADL